MTQSTEVFEALLDAARTAAANSYSPYSKFAVGAAVQTQDGTIVTGCNVENASLGLSICAERVALTSAVAQGHRSFRALAIVGPEGADCAPCGACRQFAAELAPGMPVAFTSSDGLVSTTVAQLLPHAFAARSLRR